MKTDITKLELGLLFFIAVYLQFTSVNVNPVLGQIYIGFIILSAIFIILDPKRSIPLKKKNDNLFGILAKGAGAYVVLILIGNYIIIPGINAVQRLISSTTPALASSVFLNNLNFGGVIPYVETLFFFCVAADFLASLFNVQIKRQNLTKLSLWIIIIGISLAFMFFHLQSKGIENYSILALVFFMSIISLVLVIWDESYASAVVFHIIANSAALIGG